jgi:hypothetical protein
MTTKPLTRHFTGCPVCALHIPLTKSSRWPKHFLGHGTDVHVRQKWGNVCPASGKTDTEVDDLLRTFDSCDDLSTGIKGESYQRTVTIHDTGDELTLVSSMFIGSIDVGGQLVSRVAVRIDAQDTYRLISELTRVAEKRGLL